MDLVNPMQRIAEVSWLAADVLESMVLERWSLFLGSRCLQHAGKSVHLYVHLLCNYEYTSGHHIIQLEEVFYSFLD